MLKYLRIAVTALSLTACVLLIVLWVYGSANGISASTRTTKYYLLPREGCVILLTGSVSAKPLGLFEGPSELPSFEVVRFGAWTFFKVPYWMLVPSFAILAGAPWVPRRFSLRTLLITTTLVAVGLGTVIYMAR
jgi:hypothetical protein